MEVYAGLKRRVRPNYGAVLVDRIGGICVLWIYNIMTTHRIADDSLPTISTAPNI